MKRIFLTICLMSTLALCVAQNNIMHKIIKFELQDEKDGPIKELRLNNYLSMSEKTIQIVEPGGSVAWSYYITESGTEDGLRWLYGTYADKFSVRENMFAIIGRSKKGETIFYLSFPEGNTVAVFY